MNLFAEIWLTVFGLLGAWYVAADGKRGGWGFVAFLTSNAAGVFFAWRNAHWFMVAQQLGFTLLSLRGLWIRFGKAWLDDYDEWVSGDTLLAPTMLIKHLAGYRGRRLDLHTMIAADAPGCHHTHPGRAIRLILWGGYVEELEDGTLKAWRPGSIGLVRPELCHRIHALQRGRSYSLWLRGRKTHKIELRGPGWKAGAQ